MPYTQLPPFTDDDTMTFGKHEGKRMEDVPAHYLMWWIDSENTVNTIRILKYVISNFDQLQQKTEEKSGT